MVKKIIDMPYIYEAEVMFSRSRKSKMVNVLDHFQWEVEDHEEEPATIMEWDFSGTQMHSQINGSLHVKDDVILGRYMKYAQEDYNSAPYKPYKISDIDAISRGIRRVANSANPSLYLTREESYMMPSYTRHSRITIFEDLMDKKTKILSDDSQSQKVKAMEKLKDFKIYNGELYCVNHIPFINSRNTIVCANSNSFASHYTEGTPLFLKPELVASEYMTIQDMDAIKKFLTQDNMDDIIRNNIVQNLKMLTPHKVVDGRWKSLSPLYQYLREMREKVDLTNDEADFFMDYVDRELSSPELLSLVSSLEEDRARLPVASQYLLMDYDAYSDLIKENKNIKEQCHNLLNEETSQLALK